MLKKLGLVIGSSVLILAVLEILLRLQGFSGGRPYEYPRAPGPNSEYLIETPEFSHKVRLNSLKLRDDELRPARPGEPRILVLGDSFTFGVGVKEEDSFPRLLERRLRDEGHEIYVINGGGGGGAQPIEFLVKNFELLNPDFILYQIYIGNDFYDAMQFVQDQIPASGDLKDLSWETAKVRAIAAVKSLHTVALVWSQLRRLVWDLAARYEALDRWLLRLGMRGRGPRVLFLKEYPALEEMLVSVELAFLDQLWRFSRARHAKLLIMVVPVKEQLVPGALPEGPRYDRYKPNRLLKAFAAERGIEMLDLLEFYERMPSEAAAHLYYAVDSHWTAAGHRHAAEVLAARFRQLVSSRP